MRRKVAFVLLASVLFGGSTTPLPASNSFAILTNGAGQPLAANNDNIANANHITATPFDFNFDTSNFTSESSDPEIECVPAAPGEERQSHTAWFKLTPATTGQLTAAVTFTSTFVDPALSLWTDVSGQAATMLACNDDNLLATPVVAGPARIPGANGQLAPTLIAGNSYYLEVSIRGSTEGGPLRISVTYTGLLAPNPVPVLQSLAPFGHPVTNGAFPMIITGAGFIPGATVTFGGTTLTPAAVTPTSISVTVPAALVTTPGQRDVTVTNPAPGGGTTSASPFLVYAAPTLSAVLPVVVTRGSGPFLLVVTGSNFGTGLTSFTFAGNLVPATITSDTTATLSLVVNDLSVLGNRQIVVANAFGGGAAVASAPLAVFVRSRADANCNGSVDAFDALFVLQVIAGLATPIASCNANADGLGSGSQPDIADVLYLRQVVAGIIAIP